MFCSNCIQSKLCYIYEVLNTPFTTPSQITKRSVFSVHMYILPSKQNAVPRHSFLSTTISNVFPTVKVISVDLCHVTTCILTPRRTGGRAGSYKTTTTSKLQEEQDRNTHLTYLKKYIPYNNVAVSTRDNVHTT